MRPPPDGPKDLPPASSALHPRDLPPVERDRLVNTIQRILGPDERAADEAAVALIDFGPPGARALLGVLADPELCKNRRGCWALLHAVADFLSLEIPPDLQDALVDGTFAYLRGLTDNRLGVAWMAADVLAHHLHDENGARVADRVRAGFLSCLGVARRAVQQAAIYGLAVSPDPRAREELWAAGGQIRDPDVLTYLARAQQRAEDGLEPEVPEVDPEPAG